MAYLTSLGFVAVASAGTPVQATANVSASALPPQAQSQYLGCSILFQAKPSNTGKIYILDKGGSKSSGTGLLAILTSSTSSFIISTPQAPGGLNAADYWIDADNSNDAVLVSVLIF